MCLSCSYGVFPQAFARKCAVTCGEFRRQTKTLLCGKFAHCFSYLSICTSFARSWKCNLNDVLGVTSARHTLSKAWLCKATSYLFITYATTLVEDISTFFKGTADYNASFIAYQIKHHVGYFNTIFSGGWHKLACICLLKSNVYVLVFNCITSVAKYLN